MKVVLYIMVLVAGFSAHSAINQKMNADCLQGKKGMLWETTSVAKPALRSKPAPAPTQQASTKSKAQNT